MEITKWPVVAECYPPECKHIYYKYIMYSLSMPSHLLRRFVFYLLNIRRQSYTNHFNTVCLRYLVFFTAYWRWGQISHGMTMLHDPVDYTMYSVGFDLDLPTYANTGHFCFCSMLEWTNNNRDFLELMTCTTFLSKGKNPTSLFNLFWFRLK